MIPAGPHPLMMCGDADPLDEFGRIERSLRFRFAATPHLSRMFGAPTSQNKWTLTIWAKRGLLGATGIFPLISLAASETTLRFIGSAAASLADQLEFRNASSIVVRPDRIFRDPAAAGMLLLSYDSSLGSNNLKMSWDGDVFSQTSYSTSTGLNSAVLHYIGAAHGLAANYFFDGYLSNYAFVDGQALTAAAFGARHPRTGQWRPKNKASIRAAVAAGGGARNGWGNNGFFLPFGSNDFSGATTYDRSQSDTDTAGNNWTLNNINVGTPGTTFDSMLDTPTANFCIWNPLAPGDSVKSNGNLDAAGTARGTMDASAIPCQWEITANAASVVAGVVSESGATSTVAVPNGSTYGFRLAGGALEYTTNGTVWNAIASGLTGVRLPYASGGANTINCGQRALVHPLSAGYRTLSTKNLPIKPAGPLASTDAFVAAFDSGANIAAALSAARAGWTNYVDIIRRYDAAEGWRWVFSDDPGNYLDTSTTNAKAALPAFGGASYWAGALRIGANYGTATGTFAHVNGTPSVVNDGLSNARKMVVLHRESAGGGNFYCYHPDLAAGKLMYLNSTAGETADSSINTVTASGFTVDGSLPSGTYRWLSLAEVEGLTKIGKYSGNGNADGTFINFGASPALELNKDPMPGGNGSWFTMATKLHGPNVETNTFFMNSTTNNASGYLRDSVSNGRKHRFAAGSPNGAGRDYVYLVIGAFPFRYANAR